MKFITGPWQGALVVKIKCAELQNQQTSEQLKPTKTPDLPYSMVGCDLFDFELEKYVLLVDYYSKYIDLVEISQETTTAVVVALKRVFSGHGIPSILRSDNGPPFTSRKIKQFCESYGIQHETSIPYFQSSMVKQKEQFRLLKSFERRLKTNTLGYVIIAKHHYFK